MSAVSVLSSAAGSSSDSRLVVPSGTSSLDHAVPVDTSKLVFRGNDNEWYCFMVLKKPKDRDLNEAMMEVDGEDVLDCGGITQTTDGRNSSKKKKNKKVKNGGEGDSDDAAGSGGESSEDSDDEGDDEEEEGGGGSSAKKGKRRKQDTRTSIHCGKDPYGYIRTKNRESPLTVNESLLKAMTGPESHGRSGGPGPPDGVIIGERRLSLPTMSIGNASQHHHQSSGHDQRRVGGNSQMKRKTATAFPPGNKSSKPRQKRKTFSYHMVSIIGPFASEDHARIIEVLWNFKSRAVAPRVVWAKVIADKFSRHVWHDMQNVFTLRYYEILHVDQNVYLRLRRAWTQRSEEFTADLEMFMRSKQLPDSLDQ